MSAAGRGLDVDGLPAIGCTHSPATMPGALLQCNLNLLSRVSRLCGTSLLIGIARLVTLDIAAARSAGRRIMCNMIKDMEGESKRKSETVARAWTNEDSDPFMHVGGSISPST